MKPGRPAASLLASLAAPSLRRQRMLAVALTLSVAGWSLIWALALSLVEVVPAWCAVALFVSGLALIPFCRADDSGKTKV